MSRRVYPQGGLDVRRLRESDMRIWLALVCLLVTGRVLALEPGAEPAFRAAIDGQIGAFRSDDAAGAYALASPGIQTMFGTPETFLGMVRQGYPQVYRPRSYSFGAAQDGATGPEQSVRIEDAQGNGWTAIYSFEKQPDGRWAISGCRLVKADTSV